MIRKETHGPQVTYSFTECRIIPLENTVGMRRYCVECGPEDDGRFLDFQKLVEENYPNQTLTITLSDEEQLYRFREARIQDASNRQLYIICKSYNGQWKAASR